MIEGYTYDFYVRAASYIRERIKEVPSVAVVLGTGCAPFADKITDPITIPYKDIPGFPVSTNADHAGNMIAGYAGGLSAGPRGDLSGDPPGFFRVL